MSRNVGQVALRAHAAGERESEQLPQVPHKILLQATDRAIRLEFLLQRFLTYPANIFKESHLPTKKKTLLQLKLPRILTRAGNVTN